MIKDLSEQEIIGLLKIAEPTQRARLIKWDILGTNNLTGFFESLPDFAQRLWEKLPNDLSGLKDVYCKVNGLRADQAAVAAYWKWWAINAKSIHRVCAALLALKRSGFEL
ncbi:MAG: hypothetical protein IMZ53_10085 [Thermoplasmata archaeon]|nr:hypothetical protein [Thermoplasmata archaeon]